jgi:alkylation response protein AidB-like acyl-CoA dehydrogenase
MVATAILRYGSVEQREHWLPRLAAGTAVAALAVTEPESGSDAASATAKISQDADGWVLDGEKRWITYGAAADVFLVLGRCDGAPTTVLVEAGVDGFAVDPLGDRAMGMRAAMTAHLSFQSCRVPKENLLGAVGAGFAFVANTALDRGRHSVAWGSVGLAEGALWESADFAERRVQFGSRLIEHQLIRRLLSDMLVRARSARELCTAASAARTRNDRDATLEIMLAKYAASTAAFQNAADAVQIHGSHGCQSGSRVERFYRDAKVQQIIEGTDQVLQLQLAELAVRDARRHAARTGGTP